MGDIRELPVKSTPIGEIAKNLRADERKMRSAIAVWRTEDGEMFIQYHRGEGSDDDLLALQRVFKKLVDEVWGGEFSKG